MSRNQLNSLGQKDQKKENDYKILRTTKKGQIVLPKEYRDQLSINESTDLALSVREGAIEIRPVQMVRISNYLETHPDVRQMILDSIKRAEEGEVFSEEQSKDFLFDDNNF